MSSVFTEAPDDPQMSSVLTEVRYNLQMSHILLFSYNFCNCPYMLVWAVILILTVLYCDVMTGRTAPSSEGLLAEVFWGFPQL